MDEAGAEPKRLSTRSHPDKGVRTSEQAKPNRAGVPFLFHFLGTQKGKARPA
ncbi:hypothetical Protein YC6258_00007 [Gynuella sunshinyii YC6258]|uniref:Uncharacterized protein n=1 Tax=Gynuella sunshinyii YC6258 TaxID=1445510 RepID=A0A0C5VF76_9GAMM|nr:hypothetical Protein YC6258_00007 [Gynuella sunshinyii YC6258]